MTFVIMNCEDIIENVGSFGYYQKLLGGFLCLIIAPFVAFNNLTQFLIFLVPDYHCLKPNNYKNISYDNAIDNILQYSDVQIDEKCKLFHSTDNITDCLFGYEYDYSLVYPTIVSENNWVCEDSWKLYFMHTMYWTGSLFGVLFIGSISDKYGRVPAIVVCHLIGAISGTASIFFAHNYIILLISRAFMGFVVLSQGMFAVVLVMEYVGNDGRMIISTLFLISYSITATCLPWIAYYLRNWRILAVLTSISLLIVPLICKFIPESLRWLISKGKTTEAEQVIHRMAKMNNKNIRNSWINKIKFEESKFEPMIKMLEYKRLTKIFISTNIIWMLQNIIYTGSNIYAANVSNNPFVMLSINDAMDVFANFFSNQFSNSYGRKLTTIFSCLCAGFAYFTTAFIPSSSTYILWAFILIGRLTLSVGYNVQYIYAAEVYPTVIRSRGLAIRLAIGSLGNLISPQIVHLSTYGRAIPLLMFSFSAFISSIAMFYLPETLGQPLPETFVNGDQLGLETSDQTNYPLGIIQIVPLTLPSVLFSQGQTFILGLSPHEIDMK